MGARFNIIKEFDKAYKKAIQDPANWTNQKTPNWGFVEADIWHDLAGEFPRPTIYEAIESEFDKACLNYEGLELSEIKHILAH